MFDEKNQDTREEEKDLTRETNENKKEAAQAADDVKKARAAYEGGEVGKEHPHEEKDTSYMDDAPPRLSVFKILKYVIYGAILFMLIFLLWRISAQKKEYADYFVWTDEAIAKYNELGDLTVWIQEMDMSGFTFILERDDDGTVKRTYEYDYSPYSERDKNNPNNMKNPRNVFEGVFMMGDPMYIEETEQLLVTFRVNRTARDKLVSHYSLKDTPPKDCFIFLLSDGTNVYQDYEYVTFEKNTYLYYRLVFNDVKYNYLKDHSSVQEKDIIALSMNVYYKDLYYLDSPIATMTVANNLIKADAFDEKDALPATLTEGVTKGHSWVNKEDE